MKKADAEKLFEEVVARFRGDLAVAPPSAAEGGKLGASGVKVDGKIFAMLSKGELVVKLPRQRVEELVASGTGNPFDPGHGRVMKKWVTIGPRHGGWGELAEEARQSLASTPTRRRRG
jgi:hypothetical protein